MLSGENRHPVRITRRSMTAAALGAVGAAALAGGAGRAVRAAAAPKWSEPATLRSSAGALSVTLDTTASNGQMMFNGGVPGPTMRFRPGDTVRVLMKNNLPGDMTNLHTHGLHVSPEGSSDNVFQMLTQGQQFQYEYRIPANHPAGTYWYHPHHHGDSNTQVNAGLAGAIIIEGGLDTVTGVSGLPERLFILQSPQRLDRSPMPITVNGKTAPTFTLAPGATERWRFINASASEFVQLSVAGHTMNLIAIDGNALSSVRQVSTHLLPPGGRVEALIQTQAAGTYAVSMLPWGRRPRSQTLATMSVSGTPVVAKPLPTTLIAAADLTNATIAARRTFEFQANRNGIPLSINGRVFDMNTVDVTTTLGTVEEWTLRNVTQDTHPFHIHVNAFQVMKVNGVTQPVTWMDTMPLPSRGEVVVRIPFADFVGKSVFHCHILQHEDRGMMQMFEVVAPAARSASEGSCAELPASRRAACRRNRRGSSKGRNGGDARKD